MASTVAAACAVAPAARVSTRRVAPSAFVGAPLQRRQALAARTVSQKAQQQSRSTAVQVFAVRDGTVLDRPLRVAVIGGGPSGACAAESLAKGGCETFLLERKMDNCKVRQLGAGGLAPCAKHACSLATQQLWVQPASPGSCQGGNE